MSAQNAEKLRDQLARAEAERDAWRGKSEHHYKMACALVKALREQLVAADAASKTIMANNKCGVTVECSACSWQGDRGQTDSGHCPDCDGECMPLDQIYGKQRVEQSGAHASQATPVSENTAFVVGERLSDRLDGEQAQQALDVLNGTRKLD